MAVGVLTDYFVCWKTSALEVCSDLFNDLSQLDSLYWTESASEFSDM